MNNNVFILFFSLQIPITQQLNHNKIIKSKLFLTLKTFPLLKIASHPGGSLLF